MYPLISVIIVTRNRPQLLRRALEALHRQSLPREQYEIIIVDDSTNDATHALWREYFEVSGIRYHHEAQPLGLRKGRDVGMHTASAQYIAFTDDDAIPSPQWLHTILSVFLSDPTIACVGGSSDVWKRDLLPWWIGRHLLPYFGVLHLSDHPTDLHAHQMLIGLNMAFNKKIAIKAGGFDAIWSGAHPYMYAEEEVRIQQRINELGYRRFYHPDAFVVHGLDPARFTMHSLIKRVFWQGVSTSMFHRNEGRSSPQTFLRQSGFAEILPLCIPSAKNAFLCACFLCKTAGMLCGYMLPRNYFI